MSEGSAHIRGIPEPLPAGEQVLWQGAPRWGALARRVFRIRLLIAYFAVLLASRAGWSLSAGTPLEQAVISALWLLPLALAGIGMLLMVSWLMARSTIYAITDRRVVMRIGIALPMTINVPFRIIESAGLRTYAEADGDITLSLIGVDRIAYLQLWPHARPWHFTRTEPMLRTVPEAAHVATILSRALTAFSGGTAWQAPVATMPAESSAITESRLFAAAR